MSRSTSPVASERVLVSATKSPLSLRVVHVGLRAVGQPALGPQHLMQAIAALAAEDADGQIERHVVGVVARDADGPDADLGLHGIGLVDDDHAARRRRRLDEPLARPPRATPSRRRPSSPCRTLPRPSRRRQSRGWRCSARSTSDGTRRRSFRVIPASVSGVPVSGMPYGLKPYTSRSNTAFATYSGSSRLTCRQRQHLLPLPIDFLGRERRALDHVGQHPHAGLEAVLHHDHVDEGEVARRAGAHQRRRWNRWRRSARCADRGCVPRPLIEQRREQPREPELALRVRRAPGPDHHPHADDRLFVVQDRDDLQSVRQRSNLVGRELDVARRQRTGRPFGRPVLRPALTRCAPIQSDAATSATQRLRAPEM